MVVALHRWVLALAWLSSGEIASTLSQSPVPAQATRKDTADCDKAYVLRRLVSISELCCVKCVSQPCSAKCADEFLPFHDQCRGRPAYVALMPLGGGSIDDFESLAIKCKDPSVIAERHHARSLTVAKGGLTGTGEAALARLEQKHATMEAQLRQMKTERGRAPSGGASADQSAAVAQLQAQVAELVKSVSRQDGVIQQLQIKVESLERQLAERDAAATAAAAAAAAAAAELVAAGAD